MGSQNPSPVKSPYPSPQEQQRPVIREQIAYQPPAYPKYGTIRNVPASWPNSPVNRVSGDHPPVQNEAHRISGIPPTPAQLDFPQPDLTQKVHPARRNLHGNAREQSSISSPADAKTILTPPGDIEKLPTTFLAAHPSKPPVLNPDRSALAAAHQTRSKRKSVKPLLFVLLLVFLLVAGGLAAWIIMFQPFTVPAITQPQQHFQNAQLGVSLQYPTGWTVQVDQKNATIHFYDSSHTDEVDIVATTANGLDAGQYLRKQAAQQGLAGQKTGAVASFAGASWQQIKGNVVQNGANFTETIYVSQHGGRLFAIMQLAPQVTYADEDSVAFSGMRSSLQFL